jgi:adenosylcobinamide-GDP ribazoletransferase
MPAASVRAAAAAVTFLTRVPVGRAVAVDGADVVRGALLFPVVGALVGAAAGGAAALAAVLTGAMHVDALADTADALGATTRERALEIMRDSRVGAFGVTAVVLDLLVKAAVVSALLERGGTLRALIAAGALSRAAPPPLAAVLPYPRAEGGPGSVLSAHVGAPSAVAAVALGLAIAAAAAGTDGLVMAGAVACATVVLGAFYRRWLGGTTGDCLGAVTEIGETIALVVAASLA